MQNISSTKKPASAEPRKKALQYLGMFVAVVVFLSLASTTLHNLSIAQIETVRSQRTTLTRTLEASGVVRSNIETPLVVNSIYARLGIYVRQVMVYEGQEISDGEAIAQLDMTQLENALTDAHGTNQEGGDMLRAIIEDEGFIRAEISGTVKTVVAQAGIPITGVAAVISQAEYGLTYSCRTEKSQAMFFAAGDSVTLKTQGESDIAATIGEIRSVQGESRLSDIIVHLDKDQANIGAEMQLSATKKTAVYDIVVPLIALRVDELGTFVMVAREGDAGLVAVKVGVTVLAQDSYSAALEVWPNATLSPTDEIIMSSNKMIKDGDQVQVTRQ